MDKQLWQHLQTRCPFTYISNMKLWGSGTTDLPERKSRSSHKDKESSVIMNESVLLWMRKKHRYLQSERWKSFVEQSSSFGLSLCFLRSLRQTQTPLKPCSHTVLQSSQPSYHRSTLSVITHHTDTNLQPLGECPRSGGMVRSRAQIKHVAK